MGHASNNSMVNGVLMRLCRNCGETKEASTVYFYTKGQWLDGYCRPCRRQIDNARRASTSKDPDALNSSNYIAEMTPQERIEANRAWAKAKLASPEIRLTKEQVRAHFEKK